MQLSTKPSQPYFEMSQIGKTTLTLRVHTMTMTTQQHTPSLVTNTLPINLLRIFYAPTLPILHRMYKSIHRTNCHHFEIRGLGTKKTKMNSAQRKTHRIHNKPQACTVATPLFLFHLSYRQPQQGNREHDPRIHFAHLLHLHHHTLALVHKANPLTS